MAAGRTACANSGKKGYEPILGHRFVREYICVHMCVFMCLYAYADTCVPIHTCHHLLWLLLLGCTACERSDAVHHPGPCAASAQAAAVARNGNSVLQTHLV